MRGMATTLLAATALAVQPTTADWRVTVEQITRGPLHHFFGYIGHARTIPWSGDGRYILALRTDFQDRMPGPGDAAEVTVIDTTRGQPRRGGHAVARVESPAGDDVLLEPRGRRHAVLLQRPRPGTGKVFTVLYDVADTAAPVREYRFDDTPVGNSGVAQRGGRLPRHQLRPARPPATGHRLPGAHDYTGGLASPKPAGEGVLAPGRRRHPPGERRRRHAAVAGVVRQLADLVRARAARRGRQGALHQPHALEPRRQPHLLLRAGELRRPAAADRHPLHHPARRHGADDARASRRAPRMARRHADDGRQGRAAGRLRRHDAPDRRDHRRARRLPAAGRRHRALARQPVVRERPQPGRQQRLHGAPVGRRDLGTDARDVTRSIHDRRPAHRRIAGVEPLERRVPVPGPRPDRRHAPNLRRADHRR